MFDTIESIPFPIEMVTINRDIPTTPIDDLMNLIGVVASADSHYITDVRQRDAWVNFRLCDGRLVAVRLRFRHPVRAAWVRWLLRDCAMAPHLLRARAVRIRADVMDARASR